MRKNIVRDVQAQVKFLLKRIVGINVRTSSPEEAIEKAEKILNQGIFKNNIEYIDGDDYLVGYDNMDRWNTEE